MAKTSTGSSGNEQRIARVHKPGGVVAVADQVRDVVYHRDFRVDDGMLATERADRQFADGQLVADMHLLAGRAELGGGLWVGVEHGARIGVAQRGQALLVHVIRVLVGDHDRGQAGDALETVREISRVEQHSGVAEVG